MKKNALLMLMLFFILVLVTGCENSQKVVNNDKFVEENGIWTYTDTENSPFDNMGLKVEIKKGAEGSATFTKTDLDGNPTADYYLFDFENGIVEKYYYVSAMGNGYYVLLDLEKDEAIKMKDQEGEDITERVKEAGRWDNAVTGAKEDRTAIETYFQEVFNSNIEEFVKE